MKTPKDHQKVEVLVAGNWLPATFVGADFIASSDPDQDENWWMDYFAFENGDTVPDDVTSGDELPPWRPRG